MRWKRAVWAAWVAPVFGGCHTTGPAVAPELPSGGLVAHTQAAIEHRIRSDAREAWRAVRAEYPRRAFTPEFRDGFLDGYSDHLDRGGDGTPPATPPLRYTRHARYFTPEGHLLLKDYFVGFKYGADVAAATGQRQFLTVPVLVPDGGPAPVVVEPAPVAPAAPVPPSDRPPPPQPLPVAPPAPAPSPAPENRMGYHAPSWDRSRNKVPARTTAAPTGAGAPADVSKFDFGVSAAPAVAPAPVALPTPRLPEPPASVPTLPPNVPTPPAEDDFPRFPPTHDRPPPLPPTHPDPMR
ncbi:hypothetical protein J0H58_30380 [bacterium]|nr:hypothetical protein [bacterium]